MRRSLLKGKSELLSSTWRGIRTYTESFEAFAKAFSHGAGRKFSRERCINFHDLIWSFLMGDNRTLELSKLWDPDAIDREVTEVGEGFEGACKAAFNPPLVI